MVKENKKMRISFSFMKKAYNKVNDFLKVLDNHHIFMMSAGISFNIFLYFIPLILIIVYFAANLLDPSLVDSTIETLFLKFLPDNENTFILLYEVLTEISTIQKGSSTSGIIGLVTLLWISSLFISAIRSGLDRVLETKATKTFFFYKLKDIFLTLLIPILIITYSFAVPVFAIIMNLFADLIPFIRNTPLLDLFAEGFSFLFSLLLFYCIYKLVPTGKIPFKFALISAFTGSILVLIARYLFSWYLMKFSNYGTFYGTYAAIVSIAVWVYYFSFILLFSAELTSALWRSKKIAKQNGDN